MKTIKKSIICLITSILLIISALLPKEVVKAASSTVYFETDETTLTVGNTISIYLCVDSDVTLGDFEGFISYNADIIEYVSGASCITGGDGVLKVYDYGASTTNTRKYILNFKIIDVGSSELNVTEAVAYEYESGDAMSLSSTPLKINTTAPKTASENALLETLKISPGTLTPSFDPEVYVYNTEVDANTQNLILSALAQDVEAKVKITGNQNLVPGSNKVVIQVVAEAGNTKEYVITVNKEEKVEDKEEVNESKDSNDNGQNEWRFQASNNNGVVQISGQYYFTVPKNANGVEIPKGYERSDFVLDGITIPAYQKEGTTDSDYLLLVLTNEAGETGLYRYDRIEKTVQRYPDEKIVLSNPSDESYEIAELSELVRDYKENLSQLALIIALLIALSGILLIGLIHFYIKSKGMKSDDLD